MKLKVVIATFIYTNYGGVLQAYALQKYLNSFRNLDVYNLYFHTKWHDKDARVYNLYGSAKSKIGQILFSTLRFSSLFKRKYRTNKFKKAHFKFTSKFSDVDLFTSNPPKADIYISGSDQVFNPNGLYKDVFYLNFEKENSRKIAYAASFGVSEFSNESAIKILPLIDDFDSLSCREKSGCDFIKLLTNRNAEHVVDPTFLLTKEEWLNISISPKMSSKYILIYALASEKELVDVAKKIQIETGYSIVCIRSNSRDFLNVDKVVYSCGPSEFLGYIIDSEYVVTDSFHGTVFSIIFNKKFYTYISRPEVSTRIYSLLQLIDAEDSLITSNNFLDFEASVLSKKLELDKLDVQIENSKEFLYRNCVGRSTSE